MMKMRYVPALLLFALAAFGAERPSPAAVPSRSAWNRTLLDRIPLYGHRNWIVIADSAYPAQSRPGIETIVSNGDHVQVLQKVLAALSASQHVRPIVYTDEELKFLEDKDAPGISAYRRQLAGLLQNRTVNSLPHEQIIVKLDQVSQTFRVLIIKTNFTLPYTSVFLQLDCAYWSADAEQRLRAALAKQHHQ
jgi:L-fucose mutarotase/ribose pyranase (RbsD/FucU family)